jgi:hypothetical protein
MENPMNAAYGKDKKPAERPVAITVLGYRIPGEKVWMVTAALFGLLLFFVAFVLFVLPSGLPYLAAKNADGFMGYIGYIFGYMLGFVAVLVAFFALLATLAAWSGQRIPLLG